MASFADILKTKVKDIERPEPYPMGTYLAVVAGLPKNDERGTPAIKVVDFSLTLLAPQEDVDLSALQEWQGKFGEIKGKTIRHTFFIEGKDGTPNLWRLKQFCVETLGIAETEDGGLDQLLNETPNRQLMVKIGHKPAADGSQVYAQIDNTFAA